MHPINAGQYLHFIQAATSENLVVYHDGKSPGIIEAATYLLLLSSSPSEIRILGRGNNWDDPVGEWPGYWSFVGEPECDLVSELELTPGAQNAFDVFDAQLVEKAQGFRYLEFGQDIPPSLFYTNFTNLETLKLELSSSVPSGISANQLTHLDLKSPVVLSSIHPSLTILKLSSLDTTVTNILAFLEQTPNIAYCELGGHLAPPVPTITNTIAMTHLTHLRVNLDDLSILNHLNLPSLMDITSSASALSFPDDAFFTSMHWHEKTIHIVLKPQFFATTSFNITLNPPTITLTIILDTFPYTLFPIVELSLFPPLDEFERIFRMFKRVNKLDVYVTSGSVVLLDRFISTLTIPVNNIVEE